jgi:hypothetical protein
MFTLALSSQLRVREAGEEHHAFASHADDGLPAHAHR